MVFAEEAGDRRCCRPQGELRGKPGSPVKDGEHVRDRAVVRD